MATKYNVFDFSRLYTVFFHGCIFITFCVVLQPKKYTIYTMPLKYQNEIDNFQLDIQCPDAVAPPQNEIDAFRFSFSPITHKLNFLPNVVFDRLTNNPFNYNAASKVRKCSRCGASYYTSLENAQKKWATISRQIRENLGYTHIASGKLNAGDGVMKKPDADGHFGFYENDKTNFADKFALTATL